MTGTKKKRAAPKNKHDCTNPECGSSIGCQRQDPTNAGCENVESFIATRTNLCKHGLKRQECGEGCAKGICIHGKWKKNCSDCGTGFCEHKRRKNRCRLCGTGPSLCEHSREKGKCRSCGTGICAEHKKWKSSCKLCKLSLQSKLPNEDQRNTDVQDVNDDASTATASNWDISNSPYISYPESVVSASNDTVADTFFTYPTLNPTTVAAANQDNLVYAEIDEDNFFDFLNEE